MGKVIKLNVEKWAEVFAESGLRVQVSNRGSVNFDVATSLGPIGTSLSMTQAMRLFRVLAKAFGSEDVIGKDEDDGRPDPAS